jgi:hypothetical protein
MFTTCLVVSNPTNRCLSLPSHDHTITLSYSLAHLAVPYGGRQDARLEPKYIQPYLHSTTVTSGRCGAFYSTTDRSDVCTPRVLSYRCQDRQGLHSPGELSHRNNPSLHPPVHRYPQTWPAPFPATCKTSHTFEHTSKASKESHN